MLRYTFFGDQMENKKIGVRFLIMAVLAMMVSPVLGNVTAWDAPSPTQYELTDLEGDDVKQVVDTDQVQAHVRLYASTLDDNDHVTVVQLDQDSSWKTEEYKQRIKNCGYIYDSLLHNCNMIT